MKTASNPEGRVEEALVDGVRYLRESDGTWRYAESGLEVPGARDATLSDRFNPKFVVAGERVERVVVAAQALAEAPELLGWCLEVGVRITDREGELVEVIVPVESWEERDRVPGALVAPEHSSDEAERALAIAEREYREAELALERAAEWRAKVLRRHAGDMRRQDARAITGLSVGRIQQLIHDRELDEVDAVLLSVIGRHRPRDAREVTERLDDDEGVAIEPTLMRDRLRELKGRGLVEISEAGFLITARGKKALRRAR